VEGAAGWLAAWSSGASAAPGTGALGVAAFHLLAAAAVGALIAIAAILALQQRRERAEIGRLRLALATSASWSWRTDERGVVIAVERGHQIVEGLDCRSLVGRRPWELRPELKPPPQLTAAMSARAPFFDVLLDVDLAGTTVRRRLALSGAPLFSATGAFGGYAGTVHDLTPLFDDAAAARPEEISQLRTDLEQRSRQLAERTTELENTARELDSFSYSVSHDLRAPLRVVDGFATIVLEDYGDRGKPLDDLGRDHLRRIVAASQRMNAMIETLLSLSRMTSRELTRERVDLSQAARELADDLRAQDQPRIIEFAIAPNLRVDGDMTLLRLVLQNLLGNAWKFTAKNPQARIEVGCRSENGNMAFFVKDNGAGFDMRFADKLFGLFQRFHSASEFAGTGVGLATVQKIIRRHGGRIWAEAIPVPNPGHGATFYFTLWE
jgi:signal transduction histidine kinase